MHKAYDLIPAMSYLWKLLHRRPLRKHSAFDYCNEADANILFNEIILMRQIISKNVHGDQLKQVIDRISYTDILEYRGKNIKWPIEIAKKYLKICKITAKKPCNTCAVLIQFLLAIVQMSSVYLLGCLPTKRLA